MGREKSKYMLPFRVKYHVHFLVVSSLPQNPLVKKRKNLIFQTAKQFFFKRGLQKTNIIALYQDEQFGTCCDCKKHPCHMFYFFLIFQRSFMHKSEFLDENKNIFLKLTSSKSEFPLLPYSALNIYFTTQATDKYSAVMCTNWFRRDNSRRSIRPPWDTKLCTADSMFPTGHSNLPHPHYLQVPRLHLQSSPSSLLNLIIILTCCYFLDGSQGGRSGGFEI